MTVVIVGDPVTSVRTLEIGPGVKMGRVILTGWGNSVAMQRTCSLNRREAIEIRKLNCPRDAACLVMLDHVSTCR